jgi:hypothetical protein
MPPRPSVIVVKKDGGSPVIGKLNPTNGSQSENRGARPKRLLPVIVPLRRFTTTAPLIFKRPLPLSDKQNNGIA